MSQKRFFLPLIGIALVALLSACSGGKGIAPGTPAIIIGGTEFRVAGVADVESIPGMQVNPGFRFLAVGLATELDDAGKIDELTKDFKVSLRDEAGTLYPSVVRATGLFCEVKDAAVCWDFTVPVGGTSFWLVLPDGVEIDLKSYLK